MIERNVEGGCTHTHDAQCRRGGKVTYEVSYKDGDLMFETEDKAEATKLNTALYAAVKLAKKEMAHAQERFLRYAEIEGYRFTKSDMRDIWEVALDEL